MVTKNTNIVFVFFGFERIMKCFFVLIDIFYMCIFYLQKEIIRYIIKIWKFRHIN